MTYPEDLANKVRRLLAEDRTSQREIARTLGVSRVFVDKIAAGRRPDYEARRRLREAQQQLSEEPQERCPGCGGKVTMPCRACLARGARETRLRTAPLQRPGDERSRPVLEEPLGLDLRERHRLRYEEVHDRRNRLGEDYRFEDC